MYFTTNEIKIIKAIVALFEDDISAAAYTPVEKDRLETGLDQKILNVTLNSMAARGVLLSCGGLVTLSQMSIDGYLSQTGIDNN